jgi:hypothetical protein
VRPFLVMSFSTFPITERACKLNIIMAVVVNCFTYCETQAGDLSGYIQQISSQLLRPNFHGKRFFFKGIDLP